MTKAFKMVNRKLLLVKMSKYGVSERYTKWFRGYVSGRADSVCIQGVMSHPYVATSGVPQGSNLGPFYTSFFQHSFQQYKVFSDVAVC